ncbi:hypothetical protein D9M71_776100 [compost metagenome]
MLQGNIAFGVHEVQGDAVVEPDGEKWPERHCRRTPQDPAEEVRRHLLVMRKHDGVIELDSHVRNLPMLCGGSSASARRARPTPIAYRLWRLNVA